jgi:hydroxylamine reductase
MFCYQCQETSRNLVARCAASAVKSPELCHLLDLSIHAMKGLAYVSVQLLKKGVYYPEDALVMMGGLFRTITNANWDEAQIIETITKRSGSARQTQGRALQHNGRRMQDLSPRW